MSQTLLAYKQCLPTTCPFLTRQVTYGFVVTCVIYSVSKHNYNFSCFLQWKHFINSQHQLQESQSCIEHTVDRNQLNLVFGYWKQAYRSSRRSREFAEKRQGVLIAKTFAAWKEYVLMCRADRHRQRVLMKEVKSGQQW